MLHDDNLENGMLLYREKEREEAHKCAWCGESIYEGDECYDINGEIVCENCIENAKRRAEAV